MPWFKADDRLPDHRKVRQLGRDRLASMGLWLLGGCWSSGALSDGFLPAEVIERWGDPKGQASGGLVRVGLWRPDSVDGEEGFRFHDWPDWQPTRTQVETEREAAKQRQRKARDKRGTNGVSHGSVTPDVTRDDSVTTGVTPTVTNGRSHTVSHAEVPDPDPTRPDPTRPEVPAGTSGRAAPGRAPARVASASGGPPPLPSELEEHPDWPEQPCGHRHDPDQRCGRCGRARRDAATAEADADAQRVAADREAERIRRDCSMCDADGWLREVGRALPVSPYARCDHTTEHRQQVADAKDEPA